MGSRRRSSRAIGGWAAGAALALLAAGATACSGGPPAGRATPPAVTSRTGAAPQPSAAHRSPGASALVITPARWRLPQPLTRSVALPVGGGLLVVGGLRADGTSSAAVVRIDPGTGRASRWAALALPSHDAAGAVLGGVPLLFGGGTAASSAAVQRLAVGEVRRAGSLPGPRSDLTAVTVGREAYLLGGYDGTRWQAAVLRTSDGIRFATVATLPVPVRYAAAAYFGGSIWLFGGRSTSGPTAVVQRIDAGRGTAAVAGRLPQPRTDATAVTLGGAIYLCGGRVNGVVTGQVLRFDPATGRFTAAGRLPSPVADAAGVVLGDVAYLLGGESPTVAGTVTTLRMEAGAR